MDYRILYAVSALLAAAYVYYIFAGCHICGGKVKNTVYIVLAAALALLPGLAFPKRAALALSEAAVALLSVLFVCFYTDGEVRKMWRSALVPGIPAVLAAAFMKTGGWWSPVSAVTVFTLVVYLLLSGQRETLRPQTVLPVVLLEGVVTAGDIVLRDEEAHVFFLVIAVCIFVLLETVLRSFQLGYERTGKAMQEAMQQRQFGEIRDIYLNMRGWRHDYHNHIQVLKADLDSGRVARARAYLGQIEHELDRVDTFVKSGNLMADAVLNSKLTMAMERGIRINCDAFLPAELFLPDTELCTVLGNLLDNAVEGCERVPGEQRFIRIYMAMVRNQFYLSIQNSSVPEPDFEQRHLISTKRGNHGLGLGRVEAVVKRREGFLNLSQEPGVFGAEVTIPQP